MNGTLQRIDISQLIPHPDNPRLAFREEVLNSIAAQLKEAGSFSDMHALIVRPQGEHFQILSGHQRTEAAKRAGIGEIPCWVVELGDAEAHMLLATCNSQGELSPLEIGIHALQAVGKATGGKGKKGGLREYARLLGYKSHASIVQLMAAAEVAKAVTQVTGFSSLRDKAKHLYAIHDLQAVGKATGGKGKKGGVKPICEADWKESAIHFTAGSSGGSG